MVDIVNFESLPSVSEGDWGWVVYRAPVSGEFQIVYYDNDDVACECEASCDCPPQAICLHAPHDVEESLAVDYEHLRALPSSYGFRRANNPSTMDGWIYAVILMPELNMNRLKVGWTETHIWDRVRHFRTTNPKAFVVGAWDASRSDERRAHSVVDGRIGTSEVFDTKNVWLAVERIHRELRGWEDP